MNTISAHLAIKEPNISEVSLVTFFEKKVILISNLCEVKNEIRFKQFKRRNKPS